MKTIQNIAIFGASGMTGLCVLQEALNEGLSVRVLQRDISTLPIEYHSKVTVNVGNVVNLEQVEKTIEGADAVVVVLGTRNKLEATVEMSTGVTNIVTAMKKFGVRPLTMCLSSFLFMPDDKIPPMFNEINAEHKRMLNIVESKSSDIDWVAVLPPHIADNPKGEFLVADGNLPGGRVVSKRDLASFLIQALSKPEHFHKRIGISSVTV